MSASGSAAPFLSRGAREKWERAEDAPDSAERGSRTMPPADAPPFASSSSSSSVNTRPASGSVRLAPEREARAAARHYVVMISWVCFQ
jgi:hypothetical protein